MQPESFGGARSKVIYWTWTAVSRAHSPSCKMNFVGSNITSLHPGLTYMIESGPVKPWTVSPNTNLSCDTRMWTAAAVVKPDTRVSDRYTTMKPTCRRPMASCSRQGNKEMSSRSFPQFSLKKKHVWSGLVSDLPGKPPTGRSQRRPPGPSGGPWTDLQTRGCLLVVRSLGPDGSPQLPPSGSALGRSLREGHMIRSSHIVLFILYHIILIVTYRAVLYHIITCCIVLYRVLSYPVILYRNIL